MTLPSLLLGLIISTLYGAIFHLWRDGGLSRLFLYIALSWIGFWGGHLLADWFGWTFASLGPLNLGMATLGSVLFLFLGYWLSLVEVTKK